MRALTLAMRTLLREWRSGEVAVLALALSVAVAALTGVGFLVNRIGQAVDRQASEVLAADLRLESPQPIGAAARNEALRRGLQVTASTGTLSVVFNATANQLTSLRAVESGYPLRGKLLVSTVAFGRGIDARAAPQSGAKPQLLPASGEVWPDSKLLTALGAAVGDQLTIGVRTLRVSRVLISRPDQSSTFTDLAPAALINLADLPATQLLQPGSRASYILMFSGERAAMAAFKLWLKANKSPSERILDVDETSPQIKSAADRAGRFLSLASLVSVLLCCIAVAMAARRYVRRHLDSVALMKTIGATRRFTLIVSLSQLIVVALFSAALGSLLGFLAQEWLLRALQGLLNADLPVADATPVVVGFITSIAVLAGFALPALWQLSRVPAIRVLRRDIEAPPPQVWIAYTPAVAAVIFLVYWTIRDVTIALWFIAGLTGFLALLALCGTALVALAGRFRSSSGVSWRYGLANLSRRRVDSVVQIVAFGLGLMVLLLLAVVRNNLLTDWRKSLPTDLPNYFFINIPPEQRQSFTEYLTRQGARPTRSLPMIRARMTALNGVAIENLRFEPAAVAGGARRLGERSGDNRSARSAGDEGGMARREQNITWADTLGDDNRIVEGRWWSVAEFGQPLVSVSTEFQAALGLKLGDKLTFDVAGETFVVSVSSVRKVKWDSFQPNFFLVFPPGLLDGTAGTWMTSAYLQRNRAQAIGALVRQFPSVSVFDLDELLTQVRSVVDKAVLAVQSVFLFTLLAGLTVLLAAVQATRDERRYESAMLRTLGASRSTILKSVLAEFTVLGLLSGLLAAAGASVAGYFVAARVLELPARFDPSLWLLGVVGGALLVGTAGWLATRSVVNQSPLLALRSG